MSILLMKNVKEEDELFKKQRLCNIKKELKESKRMLLEQQNALILEQQKLLLQILRKQ